MNLLSRLVVPFVFLVVACGIASFLWLQYGQEHEQLLNQFNQTQAPESDSILSDDTVLRRYIITYGLAPTMRVMIAASERAKIDCHNRAHQFGRMSYEEFGDEILKLNLPECHSGFYHGAIEAYFKKNGTAGLKDKLSFICPPTLNTFFMHQCRHGLGHGLMAWSSYDLPATLDYCNYLDEDKAKASCRTGAYMENIVGSLTDSAEARALGHFTKYVSSDPQYPCNIVKEEYKADCYFLQTDRMHQLGGTFQSIVDGCTAAPEAYHYTCFASMGRTIAGMLRGRPAEAIAACQLIPDHQNRVMCIDAIAKDSIWDPSGADAGLTFCGLVLPEDGQYECYQGLMYHAAYVMDTAQRTAFCARIPVEYAANCFDSPPQ